jgi:hypothetical protein
MVGATRNRGRKNLLYPVFQECAKLMNDEFWSSLYEDLSYAKYPKNVYISNGCVFVGSKYKNSGYSFINKTPQIIAKELYEFLSQNTSIYSVKDVKQRKLKMDKLKGKPNKIIKFSQIKHKNEKEIYIIQYVIRCKHKYKLTWNEARELLSLIEIGFLDHRLVSGNVIITDGEIESIEGLEFLDEGHRDEGTSGCEPKFEITSESSIKDEQKILDDLYLSDKWNNKCKSKGSKGSKEEE